MKRTKKDLLSSITKEYSSAKVIANNTLKIEYKDGTTAIRFHDTDIITTIKNGTQILNSGGFRTKTTKERLNDHIRPYVSQSNYRWYVGGVLFFDGIKIKDGKVLNKSSAPKEKDARPIKKRIDKYCNLITKDNLPIPNNGDCWYCLMFDKEGRQTDHLNQHLKDGYLFGSILVNSMRETGYNDQQIRYHYHLKLHDTFKRSVKKYLKKRLI